MDTNEHEWMRADSDLPPAPIGGDGEWGLEEDAGPFWDEARQVVGCAMEVLNELGHGLLEKPYENALAVELQRRGLRYVQQPRYEVRYKGVQVGEFVPDLIVCDSIVVDTKVVDRLSDQEGGQMINYLKITGLRAGLLLNFRRPRLEWKRIVL